MGIIGMFTALFLKTVSISLMMTPVIAAALAVRAGLARIGVSAGVRYRLWVVPAVALVIVLMCAAGALAGVMPSGSAQQSSGTVLSGGISTVSADNVQAADAGNGGVSDDGIDGAAAGNAANGRTANITVGTSDASSAMYNMKENLASGIFGNVTNRAEHPSSVVIALAGIWLAGVICIFAFAAVSCARVRRQTRFAVKAGSRASDASEYITALSAAKGNRVDIYESSEIELPFVSGVIRPRIYMPAGMAGDDAANIIAHEAEHIRRKDSAVILIAWACCAVSWFDPFFWIAYAMLRRDMEMSCDEVVTGMMNREDTAGYMNTMLRMSAPGARRGQNAFVPGFAAGESDVEMRVENLVSEKKRRPLATAAAVILCIAIVAGCVFGYSRYQAKYYNINDAELLTAEQVVKLLKINGVRLTADSGYDAENMTVKLNRSDDDTSTVPDVYNVRAGGMNVKIFLYIFDRYIDYDSEVMEIPYPAEYDPYAYVSDDVDASMWRASMSDRLIYGKNMMLIPYVSESEIFKGMNVDRQHYEAGANLSDRDSNTIAHRNRAYNEMNDNINDILFYKAFEGTDTIYAGESGDWRFAFPVKMFSLSYTDDNESKWISAMKSAGYLYMSYKDGDPTLYGPVQSISITKGNRSSFHRFDDNDHLEYVYDESSNDMGGMYRVTNFDFAGRFKWHYDSLEVTLGLMDGSEVTAECTDIE